MKSASIYLAAFFFLAFTNVINAAEENLVFMIGEKEYDTWETLPEFAETELKPKGYRIKIVYADPVQENSFPGLVEALKDADLLFLSVRRRFPPKEQLDAVRAHLESGRPLVGVRTASHAFAVSRNVTLTDPTQTTWQNFDPEVLGGHYSTYYTNDQMTTISPASGAEVHPILKGVSVTTMIGNAPLYIVSPLEQDAGILLVGTTPVRVGDVTELKSEPVAWTRLYGPNRARVFYTSLGNAEDFENREFRRLLVNSIEWALER